MDPFELDKEFQMYSIHNVEPITRKTATIMSTVASSLPTLPWPLKWRTWSRKKTNWFQGWESTR